MPSVNRVILMGHLGRAPVLRSGPTGEAAARIALVTASCWTPRSTGMRKAHEEWHKVVCYRRLAELVAWHLRTGTSVYV